ncbi:MAG: hypothetical protein ORN51_14710 [Akkermansiaceae bacterium]|nr:hypothetical protein [Akkermansiaceae bacterium]
MKNLCLAGLMTAVSMVPVRAELPMLSEKDWLGYFVGSDNKNYQFGVSTMGKIQLKAKSKTGAVLGQSQAVDIGIVVEETQADGKVVERKMLPESLESAQPATRKPEHVVIRGKVTGDVGFEMTITGGKSGDILLGGKLLDSSQLKGTSKFLIVVKFPNAYADAKKDGDKKTEKTFEEKIKKDRLQLILVDKKRLKIETSGVAVADLTQINSVGIAAAQLGLSAYQGKEFEVTASENSMMKIVPAGAGPLHAGFTLSWSADSAKDPKGQAQLAVKVR